MKLGCMVQSVIEEEVLHEPFNPYDHPAVTEGEAIGNCHSRHQGYVAARIRYRESAAWLDGARTIDAFSFTLTGRDLGYQPFCNDERQGNRAPPRFRSRVVSHLLGPFSVFSFSSSSYVLSLAKQHRQMALRRKNKKQKKRRRVPAGV